MQDKDRDERVLHQRMEWFSKKYTPMGKEAAAEFHADLLMLVQAVHRDASRHTHDLLVKALAAVPNPWPLVRVPDGQAFTGGKG
jgi:hypothetical protein